MKFLQKLLSALLITCYLLLTTVIPASAAEPTKTFGDFQKALKDSKFNKESFDYQSAIPGLTGSLASTIFGCVITGSDGRIDYKECPNSLKVAAIPTMSNAIAAAVTNPPASGTQYMAYLGERFHLIQPAYAQEGFGFRRNTEPFLNIWRAVRNFTYLLFVIGAVIFGLMIMFRERISPQVVITVQSALPRLIIALALVTFSYAIVGFLIDFIYVIFGFFVFGLSYFGVSGFDANAKFDEFIKADWGTTNGFILRRGLNGAWDVIRGGGGLSATVGGGVLGIIATIIRMIAVLAGGAAVVSAITTTLLPLLVGLGLTLIFFLFRVLFALAKAYILLIFHLILAPVIILVSVVGNFGIWNGWLRGVVVNLFVFPTVGFVIFITELLISKINSSSNLWGPPYVGSNDAIINGLLALGAILLLPTIPDFLSQVFGVRTNIPLQTPGVSRSIQEGIGNLAGLGQKAWGSKFGGGGAAAGGGAGGGGAGACLPFHAFIETPNGLCAIGKLKVGMRVWTTNNNGLRIAATIISVRKLQVPPTHKMAQIVLEDGRKLLGSLTHPTADNRLFKNLRVGDNLDGARIIDINYHSYSGGTTHDILPSGDTGTYWANGILIGSTLKNNEYQTSNFNTL